ncbi:hypothetical protein LguiB_003312 [Lonicera macranthoides]
MTPGLLRNAHRIHEFATDILKETGGTFIFKGPWFANMDMVITADPANIHHILSKNFSNYPKGPEFRKIFDILGDGIFNSDSELWGIHRKTTMSLMNHAAFQDLLERVIWRKVEKGLIPLLEHVCEEAEEVDLQEIFQRFTFDSICSLVLDYDPLSLSMDLPHIECAKAFNDTEKALLYRHILPECCWNLQKKLQIGKEKKLNEAWESFDQFIYHCISLKQSRTKDQGQMGSFNLLTSYMKAYKEEGGTSGDPNKFLRDTLLSLMIAGRDTTSTALTWSTNPLVEIKIQEEIKSNMNLKDEEKRCFKAEELRKIVYLHGALCEALRLYPPVSLEHKAPVQPDTLPSGHWIDRNTKTVLCFYSMGRMETIWGKDCLDFKPERWIAERGGIKHEPSFNFPAYNAGPRTCTGKDMAFTQMKIVAANIIHNYIVEVVESHPITPSDSIILQMKHGLKVRCTKRRVVPQMLVVELSPSGRVLRQGSNSNIVNWSVGMARRSYLGMTGVDWRLQYPFTRR